MLMKLHILTRDYFSAQTIDFRFNPQASKGPTSPPYLFFDVTFIND
jgi:hypothetical protein